MTNVAPHLKNLRETPNDLAAESGRKVVVLVGNGKGPKVAFRAKKVCVRICGLVDGGKLLLDIDGTKHEFDSNGHHVVLGGEFAKAESINSKPVICEILIGDAYAVHHAEPG
jgi:hypothetical protein